MNRKQLVELLEELAKGDLSEGKDIADHPCMVAVRMIDIAFEDVETLRKVANEQKRSCSKKISLLLGLAYNPEV